MKTFSIIAVLLIGVFVYTLSRGGGGGSNQVTLQAAPGTGVVQLLGATNASAAVLRQLPDGTTCAKISGPAAVTIEGIAMSFYKVNCNGVTGYVNAKWVR